MLGFSTDWYDQDDVARRMIISSLGGDHEETMSSMPDDPRSRCGSVRAVYSKSSCAQGRTAAYGRVFQNRALRIVDRHPYRHRREVRGSSLVAHHTLANSNWRTAVKSQSVPPHPAWSRHSSDCGAWSSAAIGAPRSLARFRRAHRFRD
jgi:hypothetical protein